MGAARVASPARTLASRTRRVCPRVAVAGAANPATLAASGSTAVDPVDGADRAPVVAAAAAGLAGTGWPDRLPSPHPTDSEVGHRVGRLLRQVVHWAAARCARPTDPGDPAAGDTGRDTGPGLASHRDTSAVAAGRAGTVAGSSQSRDASSAGWADPVGSSPAVGAVAGALPDSPESPSAEQVLPGLHSRAVAAGLPRQVVHRQVASAMGHLDPGPERPRLVAAVLGRTVAAGAAADTDHFRSLGRGHLRQVAPSPEPAALIVLRRIPAVRTADTWVYC